MSKRKPATASKHAGHPKISAKAQRAAQAIVRSPKDGRIRSAGEGENQSSPKPVNGKQEALESPETALQDDYNQTVTALQDDFEQTVTDSEAKKLASVSLASANAGAYQAKLLEMAHANMQLAFEFAQRIATMRSPVEFPGVILEFAGKRIAMFGNYSREMAELGRVLVNQGMPVWRQLYP
jgi:hypothetical protein